MRNFELPGRSCVHATEGMAATSHPLATLAALDVLRSGGNAMDAAVAACAVQCVVEPQSTGIGGDCFVLYAPRGGGEIVAFNGSGRAPAAAETGWYRANGIDEIVPHSPHAVTVPGAIDAWDQLLRDHGTRELGELLEPAIRHAREGYPIPARVHRDWSSAPVMALLKQDPNARRIFLPDGKAPGLGKLHRQPELAATLERIAKEGRDGFYLGPVAEDIVSYLRAQGGLHSLEDFAEHRGEYVTPIKTRYRGREIYECPPNGQGVAALQMLNILSGLMPDIDDPLSAERLHFAVEAARLGYNDRDHYVTDPDQVEVPVERLLSESYAEELRARIDPARRMAELPARRIPVHADTVYLCVVDRDRNAVSFINSLFHSFGSGYVAPKTGIVLQNRGESFSTDPDDANCIAPRKRPLHTIIPGMVVKDGRAVMPFGVMGGMYQAMGHAWFLANLYDFGLDPQEALDLPRVFAMPHGPVHVESGVPKSAVEGLIARGHETAPPPKPIGGGQAIVIDWDEGVLTGASEPRKDGCALGY
ncbi:MAG TPA: gamma-glutamyltransferase [Kiloniellales bacterium]|nr:gamma-glutamyltransferase [Kiloniellales bacterium]